MEDTSNVEAETKRGDAAGAAPRAQPRRCVLVVDDNVDAADALAEMLRLEGFVAEVAYDGSAALALLASYRADVAVLDVGLPQIDGYELARRLRADATLGPRRLIAMTGFGRPEDRARSDEAGFDAHLVKPVDLETLVAAIEAGEPG